MAADRIQRRAGAASGARQRLASLLDPDTFVALGGFTTSEEDGGSAVAVGFGAVGGREVAVYAVDPDPGGELDEPTAEKILRVQELALRNRVPILAVDEPWGPRPEAGMVILAGLASVMAGRVAASGVVPQIQVATSIGGLAPRGPRGLTDFTFAVALPAPGGEGHPPPHAGGGHPHPFRRPGKAFPPPHPPAGAAPADFVYGSETDCWSGVRRLLSYLPSSCMDRPPRLPGALDPERADPELHALLPGRPGAPYDARGMISRVLDDGQWMEARPHLASALIVGFGRLDGHAVGVVASQPAVGGGALDAASASRAAGFVRFCDAFNLPLLSLVDCPGWATAAPHETGPVGPGSGAGLFSAYVEATVPKLTVVTGQAYGDGYLLLAPREAGADLYMAWPWAQFAASGPGFAGDPRGEAGERALPVVDAYAAAERGFIDRLIEPRETRRELIRGLRLCLGKTVDLPPRKHRTGGAW